MSENLVSAFKIVSKMSADLRMKLYGETIIETVLWEKTVSVPLKGIVALILAIVMGRILLWTTRLLHRSSS